MPLPDGVTFDTDDDEADDEDDDPPVDAIESDFTLRSDEYHVPETLAGKDRWFPWGYPDGPGRKIPVAAHDGAPGVKASYKDEKNWGSLEATREWLDHGLTWIKGHGTLIDADDDLILMDVDDAINPETGEILPMAWGLMQQFDTFQQISTSGGGAHAIFRAPDLVDEFDSATINIPGHPDAEIEFYTGPRFIAFTGDHIEGTPKDIHDCSDVARIILEDELRDDTSSSSGRERSLPDLPDADYDAPESSSNIEDIFEAIRRVTPRDIRLRSERTEGDYGERQSFDPSWENSESGTRLGWDTDTGFVYRRGDRGIDALQVVALEERIITSPTDYPEGEDFWSAVDALRDRGASIPEYEPPESGGEQMFVGPGTAAKYLEPDEQRRFARRHGVEWPTVEDVRQKLREEVHAAIGDGERAVLRSPTGSGKTYGVATEDWYGVPDLTGDKPVIHAHKTREQRDEAAEMSREAHHHSEVHVLKGRKETCPVAAGECDPGDDRYREDMTVEKTPPSQWIDYMCDTLGIPYSTVHSWVEEKTDETLPCEQDGPCPSKQRFDGIPRDDDGNPSHQIIHCTHQFLHVPSLRYHTNVVIDEQPDFGIDIGEEGLSPGQIRDDIDDYLQQIDAPVSHFHELATASDTGMNPNWDPSGGVVEGVVLGEAKQGFAEEMDEALDERPGINWYSQGGGRHALTQAFAKAVWKAEPTAENRLAATVTARPPRLDESANDSDYWNRMKVRVVFSESYKILTAHAVPDMHAARSVVGLDASAMEGDPVWRVNTESDLETRRVLDPREELKYRRYERGLVTVQIGENTNPVTNTDYLDSIGRKWDAILYSLRQQHPDLSSAVTSKKARPRLNEAMRKAGVDEPYLMHYGNELGRNDFEGESVGFVAGAIDPGDGPILDTLAALGLDAEPERKTCPVCDGDGCGDHDDCHLGRRRVHGRGFVGPDADAAEKVLQSVREKHIGQSIGRYARKAGDTQDRALVYVHTDAAPEGMIDAQVAGPEWVTNVDQRDRLQWVANKVGGATAKEMADHFDIDKTTAWRTLKTATEKGILRAIDGGGAFGATVFRPSQTFTSAGSFSIGSEGSEGVAPDVLQSYTFTAMVTYFLDGDARFGTTGETELEKIIPLDEFTGVTDPPPDGLGAD